MKRLLWTLVVLVVLALAVDRGGDLVAERLVAQRLQKEQDLPTEPTVSIEGFPFLTQFAQGRYDDVSVGARSVPVPKTDLDLKQVRVNFGDVVTNRDFTRFRAARADATAVIDYDDLGRQLDLKAAYAGGGKIDVTKTFKVLGSSFDASASVKVSYEDGALKLGDLDLSDNLPSGIADQLSAAVNDSVGLDDLPFDVTVRSLRATDEGILVRLSGTDLSYTS